MAPIDEALNLIERATQLVTAANQSISEVINRDKTITDEHDGANIRVGKLEDACRHYFLISEQYEALDEIRKKIGAQLDFMSREVIPEIMSERGVRNITLDDVQRQFSKSVRVSASMANKEAAMKWLVDNEYGDLIQQSVNSSSLSSFAKQYIEEMQKDLPDCFKISTMTVTQMRKSTKG
jgi:hypothetical protein